MEKVTALRYDLSPIVCDADGDGRGPRTTPTGLVCRVFTGKPRDSREETALNTEVLGRFPSLVDTTATFAERFELLEGLELLFAFDPCLDLELRDVVGSNHCVVSFGSIGPDCGLFSLIGGCADRLDAHD